MPSFARTRYQAAGVLAIGVLLMAFVVWALVHVRPSALPLHHDTNRDLHAALTALHTGEAPLLGPPTSMAGISQGALWTVHLAALLGLGGDMDTIAVISTLLLILALVVIALTGGILAERAAGIGGALLATVALVLAPQVWRVQWNPSLVPLPAALTLLFTLEAVRFGKILPAVLAAVALALAAQLHPTAWLLIPMVGFSLWHHRRGRMGNPWVFAVLSLVVLLPFGLYGAQALWLNLAALAHGGPQLPGESQNLAIAGLCGATLCAALLQGFAATFRPAYTRPAHGALAWLAGTPALLVLLTMWFSGTGPAPRHLLPFLPGASLVLAAVPANLLRLRPLQESRTWLKWLSPGAALLGLAVATLSTYPPGITYSYAEARWIANQLTDDGLCDPAVVAASLHAPHLWVLLGAVQAYQVGAEPCYRKETTPRLVARLPEPTGRLPAAWKVRAGPAGPLALIPQPDILDWAEFSWQGPSDSTFQPGGYRLDAEQSAPGYPTWQNFFRSGEPGCLTVQVHAHVPRNTTATVVLLPQAPRGGTTETVTAVTHLTVEGRGQGWVEISQSDASGGILELRWCIDHPVPQEVLRGPPPVAVGLGPEGHRLRTILRPTPEDS